MKGNWIFYVYNILIQYLIIYLIFIREGNKVVSQKEILNFIFEDIIIKRICKQYFLTMNIIKLK